MHVKTVKAYYVFKILHQRQTEFMSALIKYHTIANIHGVLIFMDFKADQSTNFKPP